MTNDLGEKIKIMRKSRGMTQLDLAIKAGLSPSAVAMYETGKRKPKYEQLEALADVFNVPMSAFLDEDINEVRRRLSESGCTDDLPAGAVARKVVRPAAGISLTSDDLAAIAHYLRTQSGAEDEGQPRTQEARILARGIDQLPREQRGQALAVIRAMFGQYAEYFKGDEE